MQVHLESIGWYIISFEISKKKGKKVFVSIFSPSAWEVVSKNEKYCGFIPIDKQKRDSSFC